MNKECHAEKVKMLAAALVKRYGKDAFGFVALQIDAAEEANRPTWLAVMDAMPR